METTEPGKTKMTLHIVAHTHWDREWYFTFEEFRYRLVKLMDTLLEYMEKGVVEYFLLDGQTIALEDYFGIRPEKRECIKKFIREGRLTIGPWYTQPNIFMSDAESQVRNLLRGRKDMDEYGGGLYDINYHPDQFGFTGQLPQIMAGFGIRHLVAWRGLPKGCPTFFYWQGSDGTVCDVCALCNTYGNGAGISPRMQRREFSVFGCTISMVSLPERLDKIMEEINRAVAPHVLAMNGIDHEFPNTSMKETIEKIEKLYPDIQVKQSTLSQYISAVEGAINKDVTTVKGELRDPREGVILTASQSMRMDVKMYNRRLEDRLERAIEPLFSLMQSLGEKSLPAAEFQKAWDYLLENHAHDSLCCANSDPSWREIMVRYQKIDDLSREVQTELEQRFIRRIANAGQEFVVIMNPSATPRDEQVDIAVAVAKDRDFAQPHLFYEGKEIQAYTRSVYSDSLLRFVPFSGRVGELDVDIFNLSILPGPIPASGYKALEIKGGLSLETSVEGLSNGSDRMENEYLQVSVNTNGALDVTDKRTNRTYRGVHYFVDDGEAGEGFQHIPPVDNRTVLSAGRDLTITIKENTPVKAVMNISQSLYVPASLNEQRDARSEVQTQIVISSDVILRSGCPWVEFKTHIDNTACDHRLRVAFPTDIRTDAAYAGQPFDVVMRPVKPENAGRYRKDDYQQYAGYHPMLDFCGVSDGKTGAAAAGDGIMEYEVLPQRNALCLTLLRATDRLHGGVLGKGRKFRIPGAQLLGGIDFRYAFIPHEGNYENVLPAIDCFRHPLWAVQKDFLEAGSMPEYRKPEADLPVVGKFIHVNSLCRVTAIKPAQDGDGIIVRMYNPVGQNTDISLEIDRRFRVLSAKRVQLDESGLNDLDVLANSIRLTAKPKEIVSVRLLLKQVN